MTDNTNSGRIGIAAAATSRAGGQPRYGLAFDLSTGKWVNSSQFSAFARDMVRQTNAQEIATANQAQALNDAEARHAAELELAKRFATTGSYATGGDTSHWHNATSAITGGITQLAGDPREALKLIPVVGGYLGASGVASNDTLPEDAFAQYQSATGDGALTEEEFNSFDESTKLMLLNRAQGLSRLKTAAEAPGISQGLGAMGGAYRGAVTGALMAQQVSRAPWDPMWLSHDKWSKAWQASQTTSMGDAMVDFVLDPFTSEEQLKRWRRDSSIYQMTAFGSEVAAGWYASPEVIVGKTLGNTARLARHEMPLKEHGPIWTATREALHDEPSTVVSPAVRRYGQFRAGNFQHGFDQMIDYAKKAPLSEFSQHPAFTGLRQTEGASAADAIWTAARMDDPEILDLTRGLLVGDPKAYVKLKDLSASKLEAFAPGARTVLDALDATKTKLGRLQQETDDLLKWESEQPAGTRFDMPFTHEWAVHRSLNSKLADIEELKTKLSGYENYARWQRDVEKNPLIYRTGGAPITKRWSTASRRFDGDAPQHRLFVDNFYGVAHKVQKFTRAGWLARAGTISMHNIDSGREAINRLYDQFDQFFNYNNPAAREASMQSWFGASTDMERLTVARTMEEHHLIHAAAQHFDVDPELIKTIYNKVLTEQDVLKRKLMEGEGAVYSTAPGIGERVASGTDSTVKLVDRAEDGMLTLELRDGNNLQTVHVPEDALTPKTGPIDPTQQVNYYTPLDVRSFYLALKRNSELLHELDATGLHRAGAASMDTLTTVLQGFNSLWKPYQLLRLAWPMRVMMDEGLRGLVTVGPAAFTKHYGGNLLTGTRNAVTSVLRNPYLTQKYNLDRGVNLGSGPVERLLKQDPNPVLRDRKIAESPAVQERFALKYTKERVGTVAGHIKNQTDWVRETDRRRMLHAAPNPRPAHPVDKPIENYFLATRKHPSDSELLTQTPEVYHPTTGRRVPKKDYVVVDTRTPLEIGSHGKAFFEGKNDVARQWYEEHRDLLAADNHRIVVTPDGYLAVGRSFTAKANGSHLDELGAYMQQTGFNKAVNLKTGETLHLDDLDVKSKPTEILTKIYTEVEAAGEAPLATEGLPKRLRVLRVFHSSGSDQLHLTTLVPRDEVGAAHGLMLGRGMYTSESERLARNPQAYGAFPYKLTGSRSGQKFKAFDLDQHVTAAQLKHLLAWVRENKDILGYTDETGTHLPFHDHHADFLENFFEFAKTPGAMEPGDWMTIVKGDRPTWANVMEWFSNDGHEARALTRYLEAEHGAGVLTHLGGTGAGAGSSIGTHQVYIWLRPEDLMIAPAWDETVRKVPLTEWFEHPENMHIPWWDVERQLVPGERLIPTGKAGPWWKRLEQLQAERLRMMTNRPAIEGVTMNGNRRVPLHRDPLYAIEGEMSYLMRHLGVAYKGDHLHPTDFYIQHDPTALQKLIDEAHANNTEFSAAKRLRDDYERETKSRQGDFPTRQGERIDFSQFDAEINSPTAWLYRKIAARRESGYGYMSIKSSDGKKVIVKKSREGHDGELFHSLVGSGGVYDEMTEGRARGLQLGRKQAIGHRTFHPPTMDEATLTRGTKQHKEAQLYFQRWSDLVNDQIAHSPVWSKMLNRWSDEKITHWLDNTDEGARVRHAVMPEGMDTATWVNEHHSILDRYLPSHQLRRQLAKGRIAPSDLRRMVHDDDLPDIYGPDVEWLDRNGKARRFINYVISNLMHTLGTSTTDQLSRHPFYAAHYNLKVKSLTSTLHSKWLDKEMTDRIEAQARNYALNQVEKTLYSLTDHTNFTDAMRFVAPFWGAQQEAAIKWARIIMDRPETLARFYMAQRAAYNNFFFVDSQGEPINFKRDKKGHPVRIPSPHRPFLDLGSKDASFFGFHPTDQVVLQIPKSMRKGPLALMGTEGIPLGSANTVLQGETPWMPSMGPIVTVPVDKFLRHISQTYGTEYDQQFWYRWLFPVGRPGHAGVRGIVDQLVPGWSRRVMEMNEQDGRTKANLRFTIERELRYDADLNGKRPPTEGEIEKATNWLWALRLFTSFASPTQVAYKPQHQYLIDAWHKYQKDYGQEAWDKYVADYGLVSARYALSSSTSPITLPPTHKGMSEFVAHQDLIRKYGDWGSAMIDPSAYTDDFSSDAYNAQFQIPLGPGDPQKLRETLSPDARFADYEQRAGWYEFRQMMSSINAELYARGLTSLDQNGAEDLKQIKSLFVNNADPNMPGLRQKYPAWGKDYDNFSNDIYAKVDELGKWAFNREFDHRPDILGARQYLILRNEATSVLDSRAAQGGSASLQTNENSDLRQWFYAQVGTLIQDNPAFGEFYVRYLDSDTLVSGSGGYSAHS